MKSWRLVLTVAIAAFSIAAQPAVPHLELANTPWPKLLGSPRNTGAASGTAPRCNPWLFQELAADPNVIGAPAIDSQGNVLIGGDSLYLLDGKTGNRIWSTRSGNIWANPPIIGGQDHIYVGDGANFLAIGTGTHAVLWRFPSRKPEPSDEVPAKFENTFTGFQCAAALSSFGTLYVSSLEGNLYCLDPDNGNFRWRFNTGSQCYSSPAIGPGGIVYFTTGSYVFAVDGHTGRRLWKAAGYDYRATPAIADDGSIVLGTTHSPDGEKTWDCGAAALNGKTGNPIWTVQMGRGAATIPAIAADGTVYIGLGNTQDGPKGRLYALSGKDGGKKWLFDADGPIFEAPSIGQDGTIYFGTTAGTEYALNPDGTKKWTASLGAAVGTPAAVGRFGLIYLGANNGTIFALDAQTGAVAPRPRDAN